MNDRAPAHQAASAAGDKRPGRAAPLLQGPSHRASSSRSFKLSIGFAVALLVLLLAARIWNDFARRRAEAGATGDLRAETSEDHVRVRGLLDRDRVDAGGDSVLWITIENRGDDDLTAPSIVAVDAPGFAPVGTCWQGSCPGPSCLPGCPAGRQAPEPLPAALKPGQVSVRWARLQAVAAHDENRVLTLSLAWNRHGDRASPGDQHVAWVHLGPVELRAARSVLVTLLGSFYDFFKDLGLPITLILVTYLFQRLHRDREEDFQETQKRRDQVHETWQTLLPRAHENAVRYLMPMSVMARQAARQIASYRRDPSDEIALRRAFYYLIILLRRNLELLDQGGGYFFPSRAGEALAVGCWNAILARVAARLGYEKICHLLDRIKISDSLARFEKHFESAVWPYGGQPPATQCDEVFSATRDSFRAWIGEAEIDDLCDLLNLYDLITGQEVNRLYEEWYEEPEKSYMEELRRTARDSRWMSTTAGGTDQDLKEIYASLCSYLGV
jgi:hypothetical protein